MTPSKLSWWSCYSLYAALAAVMLIDKDSLSVTYFGRWLKDSHPPPARTSAWQMYHCSSGFSVLWVSLLWVSGSQMFQITTPRWSQAGRESTKDQLPLFRLFHSASRLSEAKLNLPARPVLFSLEPRWEGEMTYDQIIKIYWHAASWRRFRDS